jgi:hypothetical protein
LCRFRLDRLIPLDAELTAEEHTHYTNLEAERDRLADADGGTSGVPCR